MRCARWKEKSLDKPATASPAAIGRDEPGRLLAIDLGAKRIGIAVCDELRITVRPVETIQRGSWKDLLTQVRRHITKFNARGLVIGLPLNLDGSEGLAAAEAREMASKFQRSLSVPVYLQDERLTSEEAKLRLRAAKNEGSIDAQAAAIILHDFLSQEPRAQS